MVATTRSRAATQKSSKSEGDDSGNDDALSYKIPADIWSLIFLQCLSDHVFPTIPSRKRPPLVFTEVCRSWRNIALHTPRLWNSLRFKWTGPIDRRLEKPLAMRAQATKKGIDAWLDRSGGVPLDVEMCTTRIGLAPLPLNDELRRRLGGILDVFVQRSDRLKSLSISPCDLMPIFLQPFCEPGVLSELKELKLTFAYMEYGIRESPSGTLRILARECRSLERCHLYFEYGTYSEDLPPPTPPVIWTSLKNFILEFDRPLTDSTRAVFQDIFDSIRTPNLISLDLHVSPNRGAGLVIARFTERLEVPFHRFLVESKCRLTSLGLYMPFGRPVLSTLDEVLASSLKRLAVSYYNPRREDGTDLGGEDVYSPDGSTVSMIMDYLKPGLNSLPRLEELEVIIKDFRVLWKDVKDSGEVDMLKDYLVGEEALGHGVRCKYNLQWKEVLSVV